MIYIQIKKSLETIAGFKIDRGLSEMDRFGYIEIKRYDKLYATIGIYYTRHQGLHTRISYNGNVKWKGTRGVDQLVGWKMNAVEAVINKLNYNETILS